LIEWINATVPADASFAGMFKMKWHLICTFLQHSNLKFAFSKFSIIVFNEKHN
jgi:hypothetical protein